MITSDNFISCMMRDIDAVMDKHCGGSSVLRRIGLTPGQVRGMMQMEAVRVRAMERARAMERMQRESRQAGPGNYSAMEDVALHMLDRMGSCLSGEIADALGCGGRRVNYIISRLRDRGYRITRGQRSNGCGKIVVCYQMEERK